MTTASTPYRRRRTPSTKQIVDELDELVDKFKTTLEQLRQLYAQEDIEEVNDKNAKETN